MQQGGRIMERMTDPAKFQEACLSWRGRGRRVALVPTMGYFHEGHLSLMRYARANADKVAVSLFVNPAQFGPAEDLASYPRDLERDAALAEAEGVDILFAPSSEAMYPRPQEAWVEVPALARHLCGRSRPIHFRGVCTVVTKLLHLAMPHMAVFGEKDWQQLAILRRMAADLNFPVSIVGRPIAREADGLAMSSRNVYLSPEERAQAPYLRKGLLRIGELARAGERQAAALRQELASYYKTHAPLGEPDYLEFTDPEDIEPVERLGERTLAAVAVKFPGARLIDNLLITL